MPALAHSPADVTRYALVALGLGSLPAPSGDQGPWPVYAGGRGMPTAPDDAVCVFDTAGTDDGRSMITGELYCHFGLSVHVRSADAAAGWAKAEAIRTALAESVHERGVAVGASGYVVHCFSDVRQVLALGREAPASTRNLFAVNALVAVRAA